MFDFLENSIKNCLDILDCLTYGEVPTKRQMAKLISDGVSIYAISEATGFAVEVLEKLIEDN